MILGFFEGDFKKRRAIKLQGTKNLPQLKLW
jgi:hypothetical protein